MNRWIFNRSFGKPRSLSYLLTLVALAVLGLSLNGVALANHAMMEVAGSIEPHSLPTCAGLVQEAEAGELLGAFEVGSDPSASGGQYVFVPNSGEMG